MKPKEKIAELEKQLAAAEGMLSNARDVIGRLQNDKASLRKRLSIISEQMFAEQDENIDHQKIMDVLAETI